MYTALIYILMCTHARVYIYNLFHVLAIFHQLDLKIPRRNSNITESFAGSREKLLTEKIFSYFVTS